MKFTAKYWHDLRRFHGVYRLPVIGADLRRYHWEQLTEWHTREDLTEGERHEITPLNHFFANLETSFAELAEAFRKAGYSVKRFAAALAATK